MTNLIIQLPLLKQPYYLGGAHRIRRTSNHPKNFIMTKTEKEKILNEEKETFKKKEG